MFDFFKKSKPESENLKTVSLKTDGMHCSSCAVNIDLTLEEITGVHNAKTNFARSETKVEFDPELTKLSAIKKAVEELGYKVVASN